MVTIGSIPKWYYLNTIEAGSVLKKVLIVLLGIFSSSQTGPFFDELDRPVRFESLQN